jgi:hypothetical protein
MDSIGRSAGEKGTAESSVAESVELVVELMVPGAGPMRVDVDLEAMRRTGPDTFEEKVAPGGHALDWAARGQPDTDYFIAVRAPRSAAWMRWSRTDAEGRAAGHREFSVSSGEDESFEDFPDFATKKAGASGKKTHSLKASAAAKATAAAEPVTVEVTLSVPGAGPKRVDLDLRAMPRTGDDTFATKAGPGKHSMDWAAQGQPNTEYSVAMTVGGKKVLARKSSTDGQGRAAGHEEFTI